MKVSSLLVVVLFLFTTMCSREQVQSDFFVEKEYSFSGVSTVAIASIEARSSVPFLKENFRDHLEFHLLKREYKLVDLSTVSDNASEKPFDLSVDVSLYEELDEDLRGGHHRGYGMNDIVIQLGFHNTEGRKVSVVRYMYKGKDSLASGNFIDSVVKSILDKIEL